MRSVFQIRERHFHVIEGREGLAQQFDAFVQRFARAENCSMVLHNLLHLEPNFGGRAAAIGISQTIYTRDTVLPRICGQRLVACLRLHGLGNMVRCGTTEDDEIE